MTAKQAIVIFKNTPKTGFPMRWLHPEFRHVEVLVQESEEWWLHMSATVHRLDWGRFRTTPAALINTLKDHKNISAFHLVKTASPNPAPYPPAVYSCVEVVKRVIGLRAWWVVTPYQLFKHLTKEARHG